MQFSTILVGASALLAPVLAQTWTDCNPTKNTTCPNDPGFGIDHTFDFKDKKAVTRSFNITNGALSYGNDGTQFVINKQGESPTIRSKFYIHFGSVSVVMKAAKGQGIVSSIVIQSEDLDEIDWEFLGGNATHAQTNYFGKGDTSSYDRDIWHPVDTDVRDNFHNYTVDWTSEKMDFYIDSKIVRTLPYAAANGGKNYPQTPSTVRLGVWAGGDVDNNGKWTVIWAGGETDFKKGPFTMYVKETHVRDYGSGKEYHWSDQSGSFQSIKSIG
jgi:beta-glucanase (GH16 family)